MMRRFFDEEVGVTEFKQYEPDDQEVLDALESYRVMQDSIDNLRAENERLRAALHRVRHLLNGVGYMRLPVHSDIMREATEALGSDKAT